MRLREGGLLLPCGAVARWVKYRVAMVKDVHIALNAWIEWKERCALDLCQAPTRDYLSRFALVRFLQHFYRYSYVTNLKENTMSPVDERQAWHLFESYSTVRESRQGKRYKDWMFCRTGQVSEPPLEAIEGGAFVIMRDVVRTFLRTEYMPRAVLSIQQPLGRDGEDALLLEDLLASELTASDQLLLSEYEAHAEEEAGPIYEAMTRREKVAVLAKLLGLPLTHRRVGSAAGCRKSKLFRVHRDWAIATVNRIKAAYPEDDAASQLTLALIVMDRVGDRVMAWARQRSSLRMFFTDEKRNGSTVMLPRNSGEGAV